MVRTVVISPFCDQAKEELAAFPHASVTCRAVSTKDELTLHHHIRHAVFVEEQRFFEPNDRDEHDDDPTTINVLGLCGRVAAGAVRLYPLQDPGLWKGDRLCVLPRFRKRGLAAPLVRFAVRTAGERGGQRMLAHVQLQNVPFFVRLGWNAIGRPSEYVGHLHQMMAIDLTAM